MIEEDYIESPSGRILSGPRGFLKYGLDWVNIIGLIGVIIVGVIIFKELI